MESCGIVVPKFMKFLTAADTNSDERKFPLEILKRLGHRLQPSLSLKFRNGYKLHVMFNAEEGTFSGLSTLYDDFELRGGELHIFQFNAVSDFNVHVIGTDLSEIECPNVAHYMQKNRARVASVRNGGLKFVNFVKEENPVSDELVLFAGTLSLAGLNSHNPTVGGRIEITVQPSHMYKYAYRVDIPTEYDGVTVIWRQTDYVNVYTEENAWRQILGRP